MSFIKKFSPGRSAAALLFVAVLSVSAFADGPKQTAVHREVADQLADFKSTAYALRAEADTLDAPGTKRLSWQSHTYHLKNIANHVNELGRTLAELEAMKPVASEGQVVAIEQARAHLSEVAEHTTRAFDLIKENRGSIRLTDYSETVSDLQEHAEALHTKLDTILDFENARMRLESLDMESRLTEGS
jgi:hypothetical protein